MIKLNKKVPAEAFFSWSVCFAPKHWATIMENPLVSPCKKPINKVVIAVVAPIAARASFPRVLPTIRVSARL